MGKMRLRDINDFPRVTPERNGRGGTRIQISWPSAEGSVVCTPTNRHSDFLLDWAFLVSEPAKTYLLRGAMSSQTGPGASQVITGAVICLFSSAGAPRRGRGDALLRSSAEPPVCSWQAADLWSQGPPDTASVGDQHRPLLFQPRESTG